jgi:hypothetical protein
MGQHVKEGAMQIALRHHPHVRHRLQAGAGHVKRRRSPVTRRALAELQFRNTGWIERKPGAMWDAVPAAPRTVAVR